MDVLSFKKHIPTDWEQYKMLPKNATFKQLKDALESVEKGHIAIIMISANSGFLIEEDIEVKGYVSIFCGTNVLFLNDRTKGGFTTGINLKDAATLNIFNGSIHTTRKSSYYGFFSGNGMINTFDTNIHINNGSIVTAGLLTDTLSLNINGGEVLRLGKGYLAEDNTGKGVPLLLNVSFPNNIDESFFYSNNLITNLFLPKTKEVN